MSHRNVNLENVLAGLNMDHGPNLHSAYNNICQRNLEHNETRNEKTQPNNSDSTFEMRKSYSSFCQPLTFAISASFGEMTMIK